MEDFKKIAKRKYHAKYLIGFLISLSLYVYFMGAEDKEIFEYIFDGGVILILLFFAALFIRRFVFEGIFANNYQNLKIELHRDHLKTYPRFSKPLFGPLRPVNIIYYNEIKEVELKQNYNERLFKRFSVDIYHNGSTGVELLNIGSLSEDEANELFQELNAIVNNPDKLAHPSTDGILLATDKEWSKELGDRNLKTVMISIAQALVATFIAVMIVGIIFWTFIFKI